MAKKKIFFSYNNKDEEFVLKLVKDLSAHGADVWVDQLNISAGERWDRAVENALESASCILAILSPDSVARENVLDEIAFALENNKQIIPVVAKQCKIPFRIQRLQRSDFTKNYDIAFKSLTVSLGEFFFSFLKEVISFGPYEVSINEVNKFNYTTINIDQLNLNKDFKIEALIRSLQENGSTRFGLAWNFNSYADFQLFTLHNEDYPPNKSDFTIGRGNCASGEKPAWALYSSGEIDINGNENNGLSIKKTGNDLNFYINESMVWSTKNYAINTKQFAIWAADNSKIFCEYLKLHQ